MITARLRWVCPTTMLRVCWDHWLLLDRSKWTRISLKVIFRVCQRDIMEKSLGLTAVFAVVFVLVVLVVDDAVVGAGNRVCWGRPRCHRLIYVCWIVFCQGTSGKPPLEGRSGSLRKEMFSILSHVPFQSCPAFYSPGTVGLVMESPCPFLRLAWEMSGNPLKLTEGCLGGFFWGGLAH